MSATRRIRHAIVPTPISGKPLPVRCRPGSRRGIPQITVFLERELESRIPVEETEREHCQRLEVFFRSHASLQPAATARDPPRVVVQLAAGQTERKPSAARVGYRTRPLRSSRQHEQNEPRNPRELGQSVYDARAAQQLHFRPGLRHPLKHLRVEPCGFPAGDRARNVSDAAESTSRCFPVHTAVVPPRSTARCSSVSQTWPV